jgi:thiol-disulfide isomerase/thioredoxin
LTTTGATAGSSTPPVFRSNSSQFIFLKRVDPAPDTAIRELDGTIINLGRFRGKVVILNLWATWCLPCAREMPSLDRLAASADPNRLAVIAVSIDRDDATAVVPFMKAYQLAHLSIGLDPEQRLGSLSADRVAAGALPLWGLPITYLIDKRGLVIGYITGAVSWESREAQSFLAYFMNLN